MLNRDGGIWRISWCQQGDQIKAWVTDHPKVYAVATKWEELEEAIFRAIDEQLQAGEWAADFDPPVPCIDARAQTLHTHVLLASEGTYYLESDLESLWSDGLCSGCHRPQGSRTTETLRFHINTIADLLFHSAMGPKPYRLLDAPYLFSRSVFKALSDAERATAEWRPAKRAERGIKSFLEAIPHSRIKSVGMIDKPEVLGWQCEVCMERTFSYHEGGGLYTTVYRAADMPGPTEAAWLDDMLALPIDRWRSLRDSGKMHMVVTAPIHTISDDLIDHNVNDRLRKGWKSSQG